ncbi:VIT family protein [Thioalkalivibrio sp. XN279]|uniref:VIT1/CCC1 transporter family protein n=1 Tax=Thioalkalivibrio sp. XN279 TaxID=2714953 RepID=UPI00140E5987|nr:VIT family protein [Thioalkalivibrio sp. XN279]NHA15409.1 VIT family protein [Thioalkalivibrio sp. XN279]
MNNQPTYPARHYAQKIGWMRATVLGANDGIVSIASLLIGVAAASVGRGEVLIAGVAGLVAGAMSMAAGEYVSVSSQADTERADLERERCEHETHADEEHEELAGIYRQRGLDAGLAKQVAEQLMARDPVGAHARDELGLTEVHRARPIQAALASAAAFAVGAALPLGVTWFAPEKYLVPGVAAGSLAALALLGAVAAYTGGAGLLKGAGRVALWGALAMAATALVGRAFGAFV